MTLPCLWELLMDVLQQPQWKISSVFYLILMCPLGSRQIKYLLVLQRWDSLILHRML